MDSYNEKDKSKMTDSEKKVYNITANWLRNGVLVPQTGEIANNCKEILNDMAKNKNVSVKDLNNYDLVIAVLEGASLATGGDFGERVDISNPSGVIKMANGNALGLDIWQSIAGDEHGVGYYDEADIITIDEKDQGYIYDVILNYGVDKYKAEIMELYDGILSYNLELAEMRMQFDVYMEGERTSKDYSEETPAKILQNTIANWYTALRDLALVALLIILVYIGIRIIISSTAPEKAKYKQMIVNWVVAIFILFLLHLIMIATLAVTEIITDGLTESCVDVVIIPLPQNITEVDGDKFKVNEVDENGDPIPLMLNTNFVGYIRYIIGIYYERAR